MKQAAPGPYEVVIVENDAGKNGERWIMIRNEGGAIATVYPAKDGEGTARLFAASLKLRAALEDLVTKIDADNHLDSALIIAREVLAETA